MGLFSFLKKSKQEEIPAEVGMTQKYPKEIIFDAIALRVLSQEQQKLRPLLEYFSCVSFLG